MPRTSVTLTPTVPGALAALYVATQASRAGASLPPLPTYSALLRQAMAAELASLGIDPALLAAADPPLSRTSAATAARARRRLLPR